MKKINEKQYKKILIDIMSFIDDICKKNNINYSVIGGTAIGAIRHKGFIPWDDDIDMILNHENYEKLKNILLNTNDNRYIVLDECNNEDYYYPFIKVVDSKTVVVEKGCKSIKDYGVFVDVFEYNNAPNNRLMQKIYYYRVIFWKKIMAGLAWNKTRPDHKAILFFRFVLARMFGKDFLLSHYSKICHKYNSKNTDFLISNWPVYGCEKEIQKKSNFVKFEHVKFENIKVMVSKNIHEILTTTFNDYMIMPKENKRVSNHNMDAYWKQQ